jgi:signal transduction histidine kinase
VVVFVATTAGLSGAVDGGPLPVAVAAALVAVGLTPARELLQRAVDRLVYGDRHDPLKAVATLGRDVAEADDDVLLVPQVVHSVAAAVRSPHVALLDDQGRPVAQAGQQAPGEPLRLPLTVGGRLVGCLQVAPRTQHDGWSAQDRRLLDLLARQVAVVAHAERLNDELARSRDRVLEATAEERRRLHEELHDGLGPALSGIALGLEAAEAALARSPVRAAELLARCARKRRSPAARCVGWSRRCGRRRWTARRSTSRCGRSSTGCVRRSPGASTSSCTSRRRSRRSTRTWTLPRTASPPRR